MARITETKYLDDFDPALPADETLEIGWEGYTYVLDLTKANAKELRATLKPWLEAAHDRYRGGAKRAVRVPKRGQKGRTGSRELRSMIREWARKNGYQIAERGVIPRDIIEAYEKAHK